jgi:two-component system phosphate regulon response regulator OmpR
MTTPAPLPARADKILVVDDDERIRDLLRRYLTQQGFVAIVADGGAAMTRVMQREGVDLIILDLMMPGEDGLSICKRLRAAGDDVTPIIMLTAKGDEMWTASSAWNWALTTTCPNRSTRVNCWPAFTRCCAGAPPQELPGGPAAKNEGVANFGPFEFDLGKRTLSKDTTKPIALDHG